jgi:hypothetical protein
MLELFTNLTEPLAAIVLNTVLWFYFLSFVAIFVVVVTLAHLFRIFLSVRVVIAHFLPPFMVERNEPNARPGWSRILNDCRWLRQDSAAIALIGVVSVTMVSHGFCGEFDKYPNLSAGFACSSIPMPAITVAETREAFYSKSVQITDFAPYINPTLSGLDLFRYVWQDYKILRTDHVSSGRENMVPVKLIFIDGKINSHAIDTIFCANKPLQISRRQISNVSDFYVSDTRACADEGRYPASIHSNVSALENLRVASLIANADAGDYSYADGRNSKYGGEPREGLSVIGNSFLSRTWRAYVFGGFCGVLLLLIFLWVLRCK